MKIKTILLSSLFIIWCSTVVGNNVGDKAVDPISIDTLGGMELFQKVEALEMSHESTEKAIDEVRKDIYELQDNKSSNDPDGLSLTFSCIAMLLSCVALFIVIREEMKKTKNGEQESTQQNNNDNDLNNVKTQLEKISSAVEGLTNQVTIIKNNTNNTTKTSSQPEHPQNKKSTSNSKSVETPFRQVVKYADILDGDSIIVGDLKDDNSEYALFKVTVTSPTQAFFDVNNMAEAQPMLVSSYKYTIANFVNSSTKSTTPKKIATKKSGILRLQGDRWKLQQKAEIVLE